MNIDRATIQRIFDYKSYRTLIVDLYEAGKTTGPIQNDLMLDYTHLNIARMKRLDKTTKLKAEALSLIEKIDQPITWLTLTEAWCGDAAQVIPVMEKIAAETPNLSTKYILRDENLEIMDAFLTNGGRSIPKVIFLKTMNWEVLGSWGPRPTQAQQMVMDARAKAQQIEDKEERKYFWDQAKKDTQLWYAKDKTISVQIELLKATLDAINL